jgi:hypothetical protein
MTYIKVRNDFRQDSGVFSIKIDFIFYAKSVTEYWCENSIFQLLGEKIIVQKYYGVLQQ